MIHLLMVIVMKMMVKLRSLLKTQSGRKEITWLFANFSALS